jgi:hypothetical protein
MSVNHENESPYDPEFSTETEAELIPQTSRFNAEDFRASDDEMLDIADAVATIEARKPKQGEWFRAHPDWEKYSMVLYEVKREPAVGIDRAHIVMQKYARLVGPRARKVREVLCVNRFGQLFVFPVSRVASGLGLKWAQTAMQAAERARHRWTTMTSNMQEGQYDDDAAPADLGDPVWPEEPFDVLLETAYRGAVIDRPDHPVIRSLKGEVIVRMPETGTAQEESGDT